MILLISKKSVIKIILLSIFTSLLIICNPVHTDIGYDGYLEFIEMDKKYSWMYFECFTIIYTQSRHNKIDYKIICAIIDAESGGYPKAISKAGAKGLMQIMPFWCRDDLSDPRINIIIGTKIFADYYRLAKGNLVYALRNYERGPRGKGFNLLYTYKILNSIYGSQKKKRLKEN